MKRIISLAVILMLLSTTLVGCNPDAPPGIDTPSVEEPAEGNS